jgi:large subunit ribosomal protein L7/L12
VLTDVGERKIEVIKEVRALMGLGLKEAKDLVEAAPTVVMEGTDVAYADKAKNDLERAGAKILLLEFN